MTRDWVVWHRPVHIAVPHVAGCGCAAPVSTTDTRCRVPSRAEPALTCCASCMWNQEAACETTTQMRRQCHRRSPSDQRQTSIVAQSSEKHQHTTIHCIFQSCRHLHHTDCLTHWMFNIGQPCIHSSQFMSVPSHTAPSLTILCWKPNTFLYSDHWALSSLWMCKVDHITPISTF